MTRMAVGFGRGFPRSWIFPIAALTLLLGIAASGRLSRAIVADFIAWWPIWIGLGITAYLVRDRKVGDLRASGLIPLISLFFIGLFTWGHLAGWAIMPSASQRLVGPEVSGVNEASLVASIDGAIELQGGADFLYVVEPIMRGGGIGIPTADEHMVDSSIEVELIEPTDPGLYSFAGWEMAVSSTPVWMLDLNGALDIDLNGLSVSGASFTGSGTVTLGDTLGETPVNVNGAFRVVVPAGSPARVVGVASVPATWVLDEQGASAPISGGGWVITIVGESSVTVVEGQG